FLCLGKESKQRKPTRAVRPAFGRVPCAAQVLAGARQLAFAAQRLRQSSPLIRQPLPLLGELYGDLKSTRRRARFKAKAKALYPRIRWDDGFLFLVFVAPAKAGVHAAVKWQTHYGCRPAPA
ncbi:MAG: hypothetical protein REI12_14780, partial [Pedobacter sp.]|nr:hypothetical protein [Pedobacter sp.]